MFSSRFERPFIAILVLWLWGYASVVRPVSPAQPAAPAEDGVEQEYFAVEIEGTLCGYSEARVRPLEKAGRKLQLVEADVQLQLSVLGAGVDMVIRNVCHLDPQTGQTLFYDLAIEQGPARAGAVAEITGTLARWTSKSGGAPREIVLPEGAIIINPCYHPHLFRDFVQNGLERADYQVFDVMRGEVQKTTCVRKGREQLTLAGQTFDTVVLEEINYGTGLKSTQWLETTRDRIVKTTFLNRSIYLADPTVKFALKRARLDQSLFAKTNVPLRDVTSMTYLKVKTVITTAGEWVTPESLNVPGQKFEGTVTDNLIEGTFEISHTRYDGRGAPPFPPGRKPDPALARFLEPEKLIESDDPVLVAKAREITTGAGDCWEATRRLSRWVAEEIGYDIPGGSGARATYDLRCGECGAHSRLLAALCRGAGIPARVVVGCMYVPTKGGSFGQHAWTEVHLGAAGWVPVDATAHQIDFVDCSHIRLGQEAAFMPKHMEILDFRSPAAAGEVSAAAIPDAYAALLGKYTKDEAPADRAVFQVLCQNGGLSLDIPGRMVCELKEPNDEGVWFLKLTDRVGIRFERDTAGKVAGIRIFECLTLPRQEEAAPAPADIPAAYRPYVGAYKLPMSQALVKVYFHEGGLAADVPGRGRIALADADSQGRWYDRRGNGDRASFVTDDRGQVLALNAFIGDTLPRGTCAAHALESWLKETDMQQALARYRELRSAPPADCRFSEAGFNMLGYRLLGQGKTKDAIEIFKLNTEAFPNSWNAFDSLAEAFTKCGDTAGARANYERSLALNPNNGNARKYLDDLAAETPSAPRRDVEPIHGERPGN